MDEPFILLDPNEAQEFLKALPGVSRRRGEEIFRAGGVKDLTAEDPGIAYSAQVLDGGPRDVHLFYNAESGWEGECSCPQMRTCQHVYAVMSALLAEHRTATVRNLSSSVPGAAAVALSHARTDDRAGSELARRLKLALGRQLSREEARFIHGVHKVYTRCQQTRNIMVSDFHQMGLRFPGYDWAALQIWPVFPANEHEFWLYVARAALEKGVFIPQFMMPVTDLTLIEERLNRWRRSQEIENWKKKLRDADLEVRAPRTQPQEVTELRLVLGSKECRLQRRKQGETAFEQLKYNQCRFFAQQLEEGAIELTQEGEILWHFYAQLIERGIRGNISYFDSEASRLLGKLLRTRQLRPHIVNSQGSPLERPEQPLRWNLELTSSEPKDYILRLTRADGAPAPPLICVLEGHPTLYLTEGAVFEGPPAQDHLLDPEGENRIPAQALERGSGVTFLRAIEVDLPPRIKDRVRVLPLETVIDCELRRPDLASTNEECVVQVTARAADGYEQTWDGFRWNNRNQSPVPERPAGSGLITIYDRNVLAEIPPLLRPLELKPSIYSRALSIRVTKKFPEVFSDWLKTVPAHIQVRLAGDLSSLTGADVSGRISLDVTETEIDWFDLRVVLNVSDTTLTREEIRLLLNAKGGYVRLAGKGWRRLKYDLSPEEEERLARLGLSARELSAEPQRLHALQLADEAAKKFLPAQQVAQIQHRVHEIQTRVMPELPQCVTARLRPYQLDGFHFLAYLSTNRFGGILADDMGLGKTLQTLAWLAWLRGQNGVLDLAGFRPEPKQARPAEWQPSLAMPPAHQPPMPALVVCPKSVMDNWQAEAARFTPTLRVKTWAAGELNQFFNRLPEADLHVINYSQLRSLGENLLSVRWLSVILDEGQYIKNPSSQTAQIARALRTDHRLVLSGTPIENRLLDLWSLMSFAMPGVLGSRAQFGRLHDAKGDPFARRRLSARVRPFVLRRTKSQVAKDLPDRTEEDLFCEIEGEQQTLYRAELKRAQQLLLGIKTQQELARQQFHFLTALLRLRQICCDPRLVKADSPAAGAKTEALLDLLEPLMEEGQKVLVFSQFVEMLGLIRPIVAGRNWPLFYLDGATENRGELVQNFQSAPGPGLFLISLKAGGFGLNLTAASYVVLFDPWWNPAVENQAIDRTHRIGQTNKVIAYRLLIKNSIEEKIRELQRQKKALAEDILGEEKFAQSLTIEDLRFLFAD